MPCSTPESSVEDRNRKMAWSVRRFFPRKSVGFGRLKPPQKRSRNRTFLGRLLVKTNQMVTIAKGSVCILFGAKWHDHLVSSGLHPGVASAAPHGGAGRHTPS